MLRKTIYSITILNIIFQIIYIAFGNLSKKWHIYIFYIFRVEYILLSGILALFMLLVILILLIISFIKTISQGRRQFYIFDVITLVLNLEYIIYYFTFLAKQ